MGNLIFVIIDQKKIIDLNQFEGTIWAKYDIMEQTFKHYDFGLKVEEILEKKTDNDIKSHKCNQCDYASSQAGALRIHLKRHNEEKQTNATNVTMHPLGLAI